MDKPGPKPRPFECREDLFWYLVGLIATDGSLSIDGRHINITGEKNHLLEIRDVLALPNRVTPKDKNPRGRTFQIQIGSRVLYDRLLAIGLTPRKTWSIKNLRVPDEFFGDFLRGAIDGDGSIRRWIHPTNGREQWMVFVCGVSRPFLEWISDTVAKLWSVSGRIHTQQEDRGFPLHKLKFGKLAARVIFTKCYRPEALALERKKLLAQQCVRSVVGWSKSKTVERREHWQGWNYRRSNGSDLVLDRNNLILESIVC